MNTYPKVTETLLHASIFLNLLKIVCCVTRTSWRCWRYRWCRCRLCCPGEYPGSPVDPAPWMSISRQVPSVLFFLTTSVVADPGCLSPDPGSPVDPAPWMSISRQVPCILYSPLYSNVISFSYIRWCWSGMFILDQTTTKKKRGIKKLSIQKFYNIVNFSYFWTGTEKI